MNKVEVVLIGDIAHETDTTAHGTKTLAGGAGYYSSIGASVFTEKAGVVSTIGDDFNLESLVRRRVDISGIEVILGGKTASFSVVHNADSSRTFTADRGVAENPTFNFSDKYRSAQYIHLATSLPQRYIDWINYFREKDIRSTLSADAFELFVQKYPSDTLRALHSVDLVFLNKEELGILRQHGDVGFKVPVVLKLGKEGAIYMHNEESIHVPAPSVNVVSTSGAGDVLAGAFLALRSQNVPIDKSLERAVSLASKSVTQFGVDHLTDP